MHRIRTTLLVLAATALLAATPSRAVAQPAPKTNAQGPICLSTAPFGDVLVWFIDYHGATPGAPTTTTASACDLSGNRAQSWTMTIDPAVTTLTVGYTTYPAAAGFVPVFAGGTISLATRSGPGQCFAPDHASCGDFTFQIIACPCGSRPAAVRAGPGRGQLRIPGTEVLPRRGGCGAEGPLDRRPLPFLEGARAAAVGAAGLAEGRSARRTGDTVSNVSKDSPQQPQDQSGPSSGAVRHEGPA